MKREAEMLRNNSYSELLMIRQLLGTLPVIPGPPSPPLTVHLPTSWHQSQGDRDGTAQQLDTLLTPFYT
jgi:hypothetical protein